MIFCFLQNQRRRVQLLLRSKKGETLAIFFMVFRFLQSQNRRVQFFLRFKKGLLSRISVHGFPFSTQPKSTGATFAPLREGGSSRDLFSMAFRFPRSNKRRVQLLLRLEKGETIANFV